MRKALRISIEKAVKERYAGLARDSSSGIGNSSPIRRPAEEIVRRIGYTEADLSQLPKGVVASSFGCGNPFTFAKMRTGDAVLDLGSGAGMDAILAARRVGRHGRVIGIDLTPEMVEKAGRHVKEAGVEDSVQIRLGEMEHLPIEDNSLDWVISNCSINLSTDKHAVFAEAFRVLKPGGRMLVSDLVSPRATKRIKGDVAAWTGCVAGTLEEHDYLEAIKSAGFVGVSVVDRADFTDAFRSMAKGRTPGHDLEDFQILSIKVEATKAGTEGAEQSGERPDAVSRFRSFLEGRGISTARVPNEGLRYIMMNYDAGKITLEAIAEAIKRGKRPCPPESSEGGCGCSNAPGGPA